MISPIKIIGSVLYRTREALNNDTVFIAMAKEYKFDCFTGNRFNLWHYPGTGNEIGDVLQVMQKSYQSSKLKFPALFNFHPIEQDFSSLTPSFSYNMAFVASTKSDWTTEQREKFVFEPILRPIYREFLNQIVKSGYFLVSGPYVNHRMFEVYTTGNQQDDKIKGRYTDYLDAIELHSLRLTLKRLCDGDIETIENQNLLITN